MSRGKTDNTGFFCFSGFSAGRKSEYPDRKQKFPPCADGNFLLALNRMIDTRCILALAGALYSLFVISNLYILSRFSDAILMYSPIFFINSSHPINEQ